MTMSKNVIVLFVALISWIDLKELYTSLISYWLCQFQTRIFFACFSRLCFFPSIFFPPQKNKNHHWHYYVGKKGDFDVPIPLFPSIIFCSFFTILSNEVAKQSKNNKREGKWEVCVNFPFLWPQKHFHYPLNYISVYVMQRLTAFSSTLH